MNKARRDIEVELGELIRKRREEMGLNQVHLAGLVSEEADRQLSQGKVSEHERGIWGRGALETFAGAYGRVLRIPEDTLRAILGFTPLSAGTALPTFEEIVKADPSLDDDAKEHIIRQYALLQAASRYHRANPSSATG